MEQMEQILWNRCIKVMKYESQSLDYVLYSCSKILSCTQIFQSQVASYTDVHHFQQFQRNQYFDICLFSLFCKIAIHNLPIQFFSKIRGVLVSEIWTKRNIVKKLLRNRGGQLKGGFSQKQEVSKLFHQFSFRKHVFITIGFFLSGKYSHLM